MSIILVTGAPGAPGTTTTALGLALTWGTPVLLVDCDRDPAQAIPAGYLQGGSLGNTGLAAVALAHRQVPQLGPQLASLSLPLAPTLAPQARFLPGFNRPEAVHSFEPVWSALADGFRWLGETGTAVVVDAGRVGPDGLPPDLMAAADLVLFVARSSLRSLAASRLYLPRVGEAVERTPGRRRMLLGLVGPGRPYLASEVEAEFRVPVAPVPWSPREAAVLSDGEPAPRNFQTSRLMRGLADLRQTLRRACNVIPEWGRR
ncbi:hypothetical protein [Arachnia propionica]|uniref:Uncharacterized protein n=1 Tax=Arachnia propionica TaxID=1750 RepID=A0A3P1WSB6_9ACTN|nr:hypothetical protein [Arachnia propionica]RRD49522.1 hypothetical protein EII35_07935 [Arachnia propionica]